MKSIYTSPSAKETAVGESVGPTSVGEYGARSHSGGPYLFDKSNATVILAAALSTLAPPTQARAADTPNSTILPSAAPLALSRKQHRHAGGGPWHYTGQALIQNQSTHSTPTFGEFAAMMQGLEAVKSETLIGLTGLSDRVSALEAAIGSLYQGSDRAALADTELGSVRLAQLVQVSQSAQEPDDLAEALDAIADIGSHPPEAVTLSMRGLFSASPLLRAASARILALTGERAHAKRLKLALKSETNAFALGVIKSSITSLTT